MTILNLPRRRVRPPDHPFHHVLAASGVTISDAAKALGISRVWLSSILNGHQKPNQALAARMADLEQALREESMVGVSDGRA